jgi:hypothetical protein
MRRVLAAVVVSVSMLGLAACAPAAGPATTTTTTIPPESFDITKGLVDDSWHVGMPVNVPLYSPTTGPGSTFTIVAGRLPNGVELVGGALVGTPSAEPVPVTLPDGSTETPSGVDGTWFAVVQSDGTRGTSTHSIYGGVDTPSGTVARTIPTNPFDGDVWIPGCYAPTTSRTCDGLFRRGENTNTAAPSYDLFDGAAGGAGSSFGHEGRRRALRNAIYGGGTIDPTSADCAVQLFRFTDFPRYLATGEIGTTVHSGFGTPANCRLIESADRSTWVLTSNEVRPDGSTAMQVAFIDQSERRLVRSMPVDAVDTDSYLFPGTGARLYLLGRHTGTYGAATIKVVSRDGTGDGTYSVGSNSGRTCLLPQGSPSNPGNLYRFGPPDFNYVSGDRLVLSCTTPGVGGHVGYLDTSTGALWLSQPMPVEGSVALPVTTPQFFTRPTLSISPNGRQISFVAYTSGGQTCYQGGFCFPTLNAAAALVDTSGPGSPNLAGVDLPPNNGEWGVQFIRP